MPKVAEPPKVELPPNKVQVAGKQEHFQEAGFALAAALGFEGEPHLQSEAGFRVDDAQNFCVKTLHEHYQAGAKGEEQPSVVDFCEHVGIADDAEAAEALAALTEAYESGKGAAVTTINKTIATVGASLIYDTGASGAGKAVG